MGECIFVDAFYFEGKLIWWIFSLPKLEQTKNGPSISRLYLAPQDRSFAQILIKLGAFGNISGFVNASFFADPISGRTLIFEFDTRPNMWHFCYGFFGVDFARLWCNELKQPGHPDFQTPILFYDPYRLFNFLVSNRELRLALKVLRRLRIEEYGKPIPSNFYSKPNLIRRTVLLIFFPIFKHRIKLLNRIRKIKRRMRDLNPR